MIIFVMPQVKHIVPNKKTLVLIIASASLLQSSVLQGVHNYRDQTYQRRGTHMCYAANISRVQLLHPSRRFNRPEQLK